MWTTKPVQKQVLKYEMTHGPISLRVDEPDDAYCSGKVWRYVSLSIGQFSDDSVEKAKENWPREAIAQARAELDKLEASL
jgi:hypothetical protein